MWDDLKDLGRYVKRKAGRKLVRYAEKAQEVKDHAAGALKEVSQGISGTFAPKEPRNTDFSVSQRNSGSIAPEQYRQFYICRRRRELLREKDSEIFHAYYGTGGIEFYLDLLRAYMPTIGDSDSVESLHRGIWNSILSPVLTKFRKLEDRCAEYDKAIVETKQFSHEQSKKFLWELSKDRERYGKLKEMMSVRADEYVTQADELHEALRSFCGNPHLELLSSADSCSRAEYMERLSKTAKRAEQILKRFRKNSSDNTEDTVSEGNDNE